MVSVLKNIGKGALYVIAFPLGLLAIVGYAVFGVFVFFFQFVRLIILFFTGRNLRSDLPEDIKAREIIEANKPKPEEEKNESLSLYPSDSIVYSGGYQSPTFEPEKKEEEVEEHQPQHLEVEEEKEEIEDDDFTHLV